MESDLPPECKPKIDFSSQFGQPRQSQLFGCSKQSGVESSEVSTPSPVEELKTPKFEEKLDTKPYGGDNLLIKFFSVDEPSEDQSQPRRKGYNRHDNGQCKSSECDCFSGKQPPVASDDQKPTGFADELDYAVQLSDVLDLQVNLNQLQAWIDLKSLKEAVVGCFVRVPIDQSYSEFSVAQITDLIEAVGYPIGRQRTNKYLVLFIPESINERTVVRVNFVSNREITRQEFERWTKAGRRSNDFKLNRQHFADRRMRLERIRIEHSKAELQARQQAKANSERLSGPEEDELVEWDQ